MPGQNGGQNGAHFFATHFSKMLLYWTGGFEAFLPVENVWKGEAP